MKPLPLFLIMLAAGHAPANEALDVLEGRRDAADVELPATAGNAASPAAQPDKLIYPEPAWAASPLDAVWARATLLEDNANPWIQQVAITGYFDWQAAFGKADVDASGATPARSVDLDGSRTRRARLGARLRAFHNTDLDARADFSGSGDYQGIERLSVRTEVMPDTHVTAGKFRPRFTAEYRMEPEFSPFPDRSMLTNMIAPSRTLGVMIQHGRDDWDYGIGWFSGDSHPDMPGIEGDGFLALNLGRTFVEKSGDSLMRTRWHLDYVHNFDASRSGSIPRYNVAGRRSANGNQLVTQNPAFRHLFSTGFTLESERFSFLGDFMIGKGESTVWGMTLGPSYWVIPGSLKLVGRYHYADTDDARGLVSTFGASSDPGFDSSPFFVGDEFHSFYLGANLHLYQDRLVLMGGLEHAILNDESGANFNTETWIWHTGAKVSF